MAVRVTDGQLTYGSGATSHQALRGVTLHVPKGKIYGLLGPSGCGKTTLLNCVVGRKSLCSGQLSVFGDNPEISSTIPGRGVGFMPQEIALYPEFTIEETLRYFGNLHQMNKTALQERIDFLLDFLDLPVKTRLVRNLSGGQQRRVSLAAAIVHQPPLLILDEPTVGVDPLLRQKIWNYLLKVTSVEGMTVIITTHYIEEARQADIVGFMRKGRMLAEGSPQELMRVFNHSSLEECFLDLCSLDRETITIESSQPLSAYDWLKTPTRKSNSVFYDPPFESVLPSSRKGDSTNVSRILPSPKTLESTFPKKSNSCCDYSAKLFTLLAKNIIRFRRNIPVLLFQLGSPSVQLILLLLCIGKPPFDVPVAVVNDEIPVIASYHFLKSIDNATVRQVPFADKVSAIMSVVEGETWGIIHVHQNFSNCLLERVNKGLDASNDSVQCGSVELQMDMTNQQIGFTVYNILVLAFQDFGKKMLTAIGRPTHIMDSPIQIAKPIYGEVKASFTEFIAPAVLLSITYIMAVGLTSMSLVEERKSGLYDRSWVSGVTVTQLVTAHVMTQFLVIVLQVSGLFVFMFLVFEIPAEGSFVWMVVITLLQGVCGMSYGLLISCFVSEESTAIMISLGSFYPNLIMSGVVWPMEGMPYYVRYVSYCMPQTLAIESFRSVVSRGWGIEHSLVWSGVAVSSLWIGFFLTTAIFLFKLKN